MTAARFSRLSIRGTIALTLLFGFALGATFGRDAIAAVVTKTSSSSLATGTTVSGASTNRLLRTNASGSLSDSVLSDDGANIAPSATSSVALGTATLGFKAIHADSVVTSALTNGGSTLSLTGGSTTFQLISAGFRPAAAGTQYIVDNASSVGIKSTAAGIASLTNGGSGDGSWQRLHVTGAAHIQTSLGVGAHVVAIASNGVAAVENAEVLTGSRGLYLVDCLDANGCTLHLTTANMEPGTAVRIVSISANGNLLVPSVANVQHVASAFTMGVNDVISFVVVRNRSGATYYVETGRSNN